MRTRSASEAIEVFDMLMSDLARTSANLAAKQRTRTLGDLDSAALMLREAWITLNHAAADPEGDVRSGFDLLDITAMHQAAAPSANWPGPRPRPSWPSATPKSAGTSSSPPRTWPRTRSAR